MDPEKQQETQTHDSTLQRERVRNRRFRIFGLVALVTYALIHFLVPFDHFHQHGHGHNGHHGHHGHKHGHGNRHGLWRGKTDLKNACINAPKLQPKEYQADNTSLDFLRSAEYRNGSLERFQGAIQVPTESNELMGPPGEDSRWEVFTKLHDHFEKAYPLLHEHLEKEVVNKYGLLYSWKGSDESLKPVILMAHQDVVPVLPETVDQWNYPPYSGHFDGTNIWGRGCNDDKNPLVAILESVELLLKDGFQPSRTVLLSFGYDEESSGVFGASSLAKRIEEKYGPDSIHALIDEGGLGIMRLRGTDIATVSVAEKGNYGAEITVYTHGGHSSMPPSHTGIGIASQLINLIEATPHKAKLTDRNPIQKTLHCIAAHSETLSRRERKLLGAVGHCKRATNKVIKALGDNIPPLKYLFQTSQAVDIINGGLKINALPEKVTVRVDNRIDVHSNSKEVEEKLVGNAKEIATKFGLGLKVNGETVLEGDDPAQYIDFKRFNTNPLDPAPLTPTEPSDAWDVFSGTVRHVYEDFAGPLFDVESFEFSKAKNLVVIPAMMTGNTDTRFYWGLTKNIYRFNPQRIVADPLNGEGGVHTVNEFISLDNHIEAVAFYRQYILNI